MTHSLKVRKNISNTEKYNCYTAAGDGCLQHYTGVAGTIESFNYNNGAGLQLSDTDYTVCVRMERNFCGTELRVMILSLHTAS